MTRYTYTLHDRITAELWHVTRCDGVTQSWHLAHARHVWHAAQILRDAVGPTHRVTVAEDVDA
jgi:hypothetical protein